MDDSEVGSRDLYLDNAVGEPGLPCLATCDLQVEMAIRTLEDTLLDDDIEGAIDRAALRRIVYFSLTYSLTDLLTNRQDMS